LKRSIVLLEVIVSLLLFSIIAIGSSKLIYTLIEQNKEKHFVLENNLKLETTRLFLSKQYDLTKVNYQNNKLYFNNNLLLDHISKYDTIINQDMISIDICLYSDRICQKWKIKF